MFPSAKYSPSISTLVYQMAGYTHSNLEWNDSKAGGKKTGIMQETDSADEGDGITAWSDRLRYVLVVGRTGLE